MPTLQAKFIKEVGEITLQIDLTIPSGITVLRGESGAGKTTIADILTGKIRADSGFAKLGEEIIFDVEKNCFTPIDKRGFGYVFQSHALFPHMSVRENLFFSFLFAKRVSLINPEELIDLLGISHLMNRYPSTLSGGESQRVALGRAMLGAQNFLILDEPFASIDVSRRKTLIGYLKKAATKLPIPILYITHSDTETELLGDQKLLLQNGRIYPLT